MTHVDRTSDAPVRPHPPDDVMAFFVPPRPPPESGTRHALEVHQFWGFVLLDTRHFVPTVSNAVTVGTRVGWRWSLLGVDLGWVPEGLRRVLPWLAPMWSEVESALRSDFPVPIGALADDEHTLFDWEGDRWVARIPAAWDGHVRIGEASVALADLVTQGRAHQDRDHVVVPIDGEVRIDAGGTVFIARMVGEGARIPERHTGKTEWTLVASLSFMAFLGAMLALGVLTLPAPSTVEVAAYVEKFAVVQLRPPPKPPNVPKPVAPDPKPGGDNPKKVPRPDVPPDLAQQMQDREVASESGILPNLDVLFASGVLDDALTSAANDLIGVRGAGVANHGLTSRGGAFGSGGRAESGGGLGRPGGGPGRLGFGRTGGPKPRQGLGTVAGDPIVIGALDRSLIEDVIKRNLNAIRYCYQRELNKKPGLAGKVVVGFTIAKDGSVSAARIKQSSLEHSPTESCIASRFLRLRFPLPKGNGIVVVSYPFHFSTSG
ncbi:MAG: AgmX/PglI C-terminal domain-containing protein [Myxococcota bacterium]